MVDRLRCGARTGRWLGRHRAAADTVLPVRLCATSARETNCDRPRRAARRWVAAKLRIVLAPIVIGAVTLVVVVAGSPGASAATLPVPLGTAADFAVLGGSTVTDLNHDESMVISGSVPARRSKVSGRQLNGPYTSPTQPRYRPRLIWFRRTTTPRAAPTTATIPVELGGTTRTAGVYDSAAGTFGITGTLTLDAQGNPDAVFVFQAASTLITASASNVVLVTGPGHPTSSGRSAAPRRWERTPRSAVLSWPSPRSPSRPAQWWMAGRWPATAPSRWTPTPSRPHPRGVVHLRAGDCEPRQRPAGPRRPPTWGRSPSPTSVPCRTRAGWRRSPRHPSPQAEPLSPRRFPRSHVSYWSGPATATSGTGTLTPGQATAADAQTLDVNRTAFGLAAGTGNNSVTWNPTVLIAIPAASVAGTYTGAITHSVL